MKDIQIPFVSGQDTSGAPKAHSEPGKFRRVHNLHIAPTQNDALSVRRSAFCIGPIDQVSSSSKRFSSFGDRITMCTPLDILISNSSDTLEVTSKTRNLDLLSSTPLEWQPDILRSAAGGAFWRNANGTEMTVFVDSTADAWSVLSQCTRGSIKFPTVVVQTVATSAFTDRHVLGQFLFDGSTSDAFLLVHGDPGASTIRIRTYATISNAWTLNASITTAILLDAALTASGIAILYCNTATGDLRLNMRTSAGASLWDIAVNTTQDNPKVGSCSAVGTEMHIYSGEYDADANRIRTFQVNLSTQAVTVRALSATFGEPVQSLSSCHAGNNSGASWCYVVGQGNGRAALYSGLSSLVAVNRVGWCPRIDASCRIFTPQARIFDTNPEPLVAGTLGTQTGVWNLDCLGTLKPAQVVAHSGSRGYYKNAAATLHFPRNGTTWNSGDQGKGIVFTLTGPEVIEWGLHPTRASVMSHGGFPVMSIGNPKYFDSSRWIPVGISQAPVATVTVGAGGQLFAGVYNYALVWEWTDTRGRRHQSPASVYTVTAAASDKGVITVRAWSIPADERLNDPSGPMNLAVYRTQAGGATLNRVRAYLIPDPYATATFVVEDDLASDSFIASQEVLYTTVAGNNELAAYGMDAASHVAGYADRIVYVSPSFPNKLFYSKSFRDGRCVEFNPALSFLVPDDVTGLAVQDGNIYLFCASQIYAMAPTFAADDGSGAVPIDPVPLSPGIGCKFPASIIGTPEGIFFRGERGFFILPRGGGPPVYAGMPLEGNLQAAVFGAAHNAATSQIAWVTSFSSQQVVVFDYLRKQWFTWELFAGVPLLQGGVMATPRNGFFYFGQATGVASLIRLDSEGQGLDFGNSILADANIETVIETAGFTVAEIGKQSLVHNAVIEGDSTFAGNVLAVEESHDQGATYINTVNFDGQSGLPIVYQVARRRTAGIRLRIRSIARTTALKLYGMTLKVKPLAKASTSVANRKG